MYGRHQVVNASLAIAATQWLTHNGWAVDESAIRRGLESAAIDGRFQVIDGDPPVIIDVAHNAMSARAFAAALDERYADRCRRTLVFSASKDKRILPMLRRLFASFDRIILTTIRDNPRACDLERLRSVAERALAGRRDNGARAPTLEVHADQRQAIIAAHDGVTDLVAVCGSVFLIGQILPILRGAEPNSDLRAESSKTQAVN
jgi:dihydrofolate synthase/folylpolyglutamate synthase